jgi:putative transport protein
MYIVCAETDAEAIMAFIGEPVEVKWEEQDMPLVSREILVTQPKMNGKTFGSLHFSSVYGVNVTRIRRNGTNLYADRNLHMQVGDKIVCVGPEDAVDRVASMMGNSVKSLDAPNLATIFVGIMVGIIFGMMPIAIPGIPTPVKLGLAGGPLIVAILVGRFGYRAKLVAYTTTSANLMLREIGLVLFLASVGIKAGASFWETVAAGDGLKYVWCGVIITVVPILIVGTIARLRYKVNYFTLMGLIAGSTTDPPALAYASQTAGNDAPAVGYSTVYPLSMFLRILTAQLIILLMCAA